MVGGLFNNPLTPLLMAAKLAFSPSVNGEKVHHSKFIVAMVAMAVSGYVSEAAYGKTHRINANAIAKKLPPTRNIHRIVSSQLYI